MCWRVLLVDLIAHAHSSTGRSLWRGQQVLGGYTRVAWVRRRHGHGVEYLDQAGRMLYSLLRGPRMIKTASPPDFSMMLRRDLTVDVVAILHVLHLNVKKLARIQRLDHELRLTHTPLSLPERLSLLQIDQLLIVPI